MAPDTGDSSGMSGSPGFSSCCASSSSAGSASGDLRVKLPWRHLLLAVPMFGTSLAYAVGALREERAWGQTLASCFYFLACGFALAWTAVIFMPSLGKFYMPLYDRYSTLVVAVLPVVNSALLFWLPHKATPARQVYLLRMFVCAAVHPLSGRPIEESIPLLLLLMIPAHLAFDAAWQYSQCTAAEADSCSSPSLASLLLGRTLPALAGVLFVVLVVGLLMDDPPGGDTAQGAEALTAQNLQRAAPEAGATAPRPGRFTARLQRMWEVLHLRSLVLQFQRAQHAASASWHGAGANDLAKYLLWPLASVIIFSQISRVTTSSSSSPVEVLLALVVGMAVGANEGKDMTQVLTGQLTAMTELAHDLVPSHVAQMLVQQITDVSDHNLARTSIAGSFCGSLHSTNSFSGAAEGTSRANSYKSVPLSSSYLRRVSYPGDCADEVEGQPLLQERSSVPTNWAVDSTAEDSVDGAYCPASAVHQAYRTASPRVYGSRDSWTGNGSVGGGGIETAAAVPPSPFGQVAGSVGGRHAGAPASTFTVDSWDEEVSLALPGIAGCFTGDVNKHSFGGFALASSNVFAETVFEGTEEAEVILPDTVNAGLVSSLHDGRGGEAAGGEGSASASNGPSAAGGGGSGACVSGNVDAALAVADGTPTDLDMQATLQTLLILKPMDHDSEEEEDARIKACAARHRDRLSLSLAATPASSARPSLCLPAEPPFGGRPSVSMSGAPSAGAWLSQQSPAAAQRSSTGRPSLTFAPIQPCNSMDNFCFDRFNNGMGYRPPATQLVTAEGPQSKRSARASVPLTPVAVESRRGDAALRKVSSSRSGLLDGHASHVCSAGDAAAALRPAVSTPEPSVSASSLAVSAAESATHALDITPKLSRLSAGPANTPEMLHHPNLAPAYSRNLARPGSAGLPVSRDDICSPAATSANGSIESAATMFGSRFMRMLGGGTSARPPPPRRSVTHSTLMTAAQQSVFRQQPSGKQVEPPPGSQQAIDAPPSPTGQDKQAQSAQPGRLLAFSHSAVSILFADVVGFTTLSKALQPYQVFEFLNELFARFDAVVDTFRVYKVETIGDCYMCATGLLHDDPDHAAQMVRFAREMQRQAAQVQMPDGSGPVRVRVGINSGPLLSGVIGRIRKRYCVVGSTVNLASRMESTGLPGHVHVSADTHALVQHLSEFQWDCRGEVPVKGVGSMVTYLLR